MYQRLNGEFVWIQESGKEDEPGHSVYSSPEIAVSFVHDQERGSFITHKHGPYSAVELWVENYTRRLKNVVDPERQPRLWRAMVPHIISSREWDIDDLNWIITNINGLNRLVQEHGLDFVGGADSLEI